MKSQQAQVQAQQAQAQAQSQQAIAQNNAALAQAASSAANDSGKVKFLVVTLERFKKILSFSMQVDKAIELLTELQSICAIWFRRIRGGLQVTCLS
jgi:hypothetical protein